MENCKTLILHIEYFLLSLSLNIRMFHNSNDPSCTSWVIITVVIILFQVIINALFLEIKPFQCLENSIFLMELESVYSVLLSMKARHYVHFFIFSHALVVSSRADSTVVLKLTGNVFLCLVHNGAEDIRIYLKFLRPRLL